MTMSKAQERGLREALDEAAALDRVLRQFSDGKLGLMPVILSPGRRDMPPMNVSFEAAKTEARQIARHDRAGSPERGERPDGWAGRGFGKPGQLTRDDGSVMVVGAHLRQPVQAETFCSVCGPLDEPGVHTQPDCATYQRQRDLGCDDIRAATGRPQPEEGR